MLVTEENQSYYLKAMRVDFLTERWEREMYATALMQAEEWGRKIDKQNEEYKKQHRLIDKYNI